MAELNNKYKDRGGPAQLGIRDWAGLKGHIDDRNLACSLASEGRSEAPRGRLVLSGPDRDCAQFFLVLCAISALLDSTPAAT